MRLAVQLTRQATWSSLSVAMQPPCRLPSRVEPTVIDLRTAALHINLSESTVKSLIYRRKSLCDHRAIE